MKNLVKPGLLGIAMACTLAACDPPKGNTGKDPGDTVHKTTDSTKAKTDMAKKDTSKK